MGGGKEGYRENWEEERKGELCLVCIINRKFKVKKEKEIFFSKEKVWPIYIQYTVHDNKLLVTCTFCTVL